MLKKLRLSFRIVISLLLCMASTSAVFASVPTDAIQAPAAKVDANNSPDISSTAKFPMFFVTDRNSVAKNGTIQFGDKRSTTLTYGEYVRDAQSDSISENKMSVFKSEQDFLEAVKATGSKELAILVHGYKESFDGAIERGLEMSNHLSAPLLVYAWPSKNNYCYYMDDECAAEWSSPHLAGVLGDLGETIGLHNITLIGHSLGARLVQWSLRSLYLERRPTDHLAALLFFSPDIDRDILLQDAPFLKQVSGKMRVFLDPHDTRIWLSKVLHGNPRVCASDKDDLQMRLSKIFKYNVSLHGHNSVPGDVISEAMQQLVVSENSK